MAWGIGGWARRGTAHADTVEKNPMEREALCVASGRAEERWLAFQVEGVGLGDLEGCLRDWIVWQIIGSH